MASRRDKLQRAMVVTCVFLVVSVCVRSPRADTPLRPGSPEERAAAFLVREVPRWSRENQCFSCHNNGDAARALYAAATTMPVAMDALADTSDFLTRPNDWDKNGADKEFSDKRLARIQFAAALAAATRAGQVADQRALVRAAELVAEERADDGSWPIEGAESVGSPVTYGQPLATAMALEMLRRADPKRFQSEIEQGERWLSDLPLANTLEAAARLLASDARDERALALLRRAQSRDGGWGPYVNAAPEIFDTAIALLALRRAGAGQDVAQRVARGRAYLIAQQLPDGSWPATTRPPGAVSYAQRISTSGWATLALLATRETRRRPD